MGYILQMGPNITSRAKFDDLRAVPSSVKRVWQGNACVGVRREVGGNPNLYVSSVIHNFSTGTLGVRILTQWKK